MAVCVLPGVELVACPRVLILDEPTSGLDSHSTEVVMNVLRDIANAGCIVICSIHQPTTAMYSQFDKVMLLARGGHALYFGKARHALKYFASMPALGVSMHDKWVNPAEILLEIGVGRQDAEFVELSHRFRGSSTFRRLMSAIDVDGPRPNSPTRPLYGTLLRCGKCSNVVSQAGVSGL
jgi:ABC-type multidrug transport system ATPase subunit